MDTSDRLKLAIALRPVGPSKHTTRTAAIRLLVQVGNSVSDRANGRLCGWVQNVKRLSNSEIPKIISALFKDAVNF